MRQPRSSTGRDARRLTTTAHVPQVAHFAREQRVGDPSAQAPALIAEAPSPPGKSGGSLGARPPVADRRRPNMGSRQGNSRTTASRRLRPCTPAARVGNGTWSGYRTRRSSRSRSRSCARRNIACHKAPSRRRPLSSLPSRRGRRPRRVPHIRFVDLALQERRRPRT